MWWRIIIIAVFTNTWWGKKLIDDHGGVIMNTLVDIIKDMGLLWGGLDTMTRSFWRETECLG